MRYCAILPPSYDADPARRYPVLYYLHGLGDNEQSLINFGGWNLLEDVQRSGRAGEYIVVTPAGGRSFYINSKDGRNRYEDFFLREFLTAIESRYRVHTGREYRGITGFSMGGYGALRLAFKHPHLFASVSAHSAALMARLPRAAPNTPRVQMQITILGGVFGSPLDTDFYEQQSPYAQARRQPAALKNLRIYFDCGDQDQYGFDAGARALHDLLQSLGVAHEYRMDPGGHDPLYLAEHLPLTFEFHSRAFGLTK